MAYETLRESAIEYAQRGWAVFPLLPKSKKPRGGSHGFKDATTDINQIDEWWDENPNYNIGIATGQKSGFVVIDVDNDSEKGKYGDEPFRDWQQEHGKLPDTWCVKSGSGGTHYYYKTNESFVCAEGIIPFVDIRADGGYIVAPPSIHLNGNRYEWDIYGEDEGEFSEVNDIVRKFLTLNQSGDGEIKTFQVPESIGKGERTRTLVGMIFYLRRGKFDNDSIKTTIRDTNEKRCIPPLTDKELEKEVFPALERKLEHNKEFLERQKKKEAIEEGWQSHGVSGAAGTQEKKAVCDNGVARPVKERKKLHYKSAKDLLESDIPPIEFIVDNIITKGLIVLSAKSKIGKSWFSLQLAVAVAKGNKFLGFDSHQGGVLYIDLENSDSLAQERLRKVLDGEDPPEKLTIINDYSTMNDTFLEDLSEYLETHEDTSLVIVDVYQKIKQAKKPNQSDYDDCYQNLTPLKQLAEKYSIAMVLIMHNRKMVDITDPYSNALGSTGIMGVSDEMMVIHKKERSDKDATLSITGRTLQESEYTIQFNKTSCRWEMLGDAEEIAEQRRKNEYESESLVRAIRTLVKKNNGSYAGTVSEIIEASKNIPGCRIYDSAHKCGRKLVKLIPLLEKYDAIEHFHVPNGNASSTHEFKKVFV